MLGLPKKAEKPVPQTDYRREQQSKNDFVLIPTMAGSHMVLMPRPDHGRGTDWIETLPRTR